MISFQAFKDGRLKITDVVRDIRKSITVNDIFLYSDYELTYKSLRLFNFRKLERTEDSVNLYAQKVLSLTGFFKNVDSPISYFVKIFLDKASNLLQIKNYLESEVKKHLAEVQKLLDHYNQLEFIQEYKSQPCSPRNNEQRKLLTFYKRALEKKEEIIDYLLIGIYDRAIEKSSSFNQRNYGADLEEFEKELERHSDFPYLEYRYASNFTYHLNMAKLDYRLINPLLNKLSWIPQNSYYEKEYTEEIEKHITKVFKPNHFFDTLIADLEKLPIIKQRVEVFKEMRELLLEGKWYSLYALALPQVEGIFSEMVDMVSSRKKIKGSLTEKVNFIRNYYDLSYYTFDYYEFIVSDLRNSFSHSGKIENPKPKCYYLLLDIKYLLGIYTEFDAPFNKLVKMINEGRKSFGHIGDISSFLYLLKTVREQGKLADVKKQADEFVYKDLIKKINFSKMLDLLEIDFNQSLLNFKKGITLLMRKEEFNIFHNPHLVKSNIRDIQKAFNIAPMLVDEHLRILFDIRSFLYQFLIFFPRTPKSIRHKIEDFRIKYDNEFRILVILINEGKLKMSDSILIHENKLKHREYLIN